MTASRAFDYRAFVQGWRRLCAQRGLDAKTGYTLETVCEYRLDERGVRRMVRVPVHPDAEPECLVDEASPTWWQMPVLWESPGSAHSVVEAEAFRNIAADARAIHRLAEPPTLEEAMTREFRLLVREVLTEEVRAGWPVQLPLIPLRTMYTKRGETVEEVAGLRMIVPIRKQVA